MVWILSNAYFLMGIVAFCSIINNLIMYKHLKSNKLQHGDYGYFWRLMRNGDRDGRIVTVLSAIAVAAGLPVVAALVYRVVTT